MVIQVLAADTLAMRVRIIAPTEDPGIRDVVWKEVSKPVLPVRCRPCLV